MSTFLTPPVWYGSSGEEDKSLVNTKTYAAGGPDNTPFGYLAVAGNPNGDSFGAVAIGCQAQATASKAIAIGSYDENGTSRDVIAAGTGSIAIGAGAKVEATGGMAIGTGSSAIEGGIAIGEGASADGNQIQLGNPSTRYDLKIGNGTGSTIQAGGYKIGTNTVIDSNRNVYGGNFVRCQMLQISSSRVGTGYFNSENKQGSINIATGGSTDAVYLITIMATHTDPGVAYKYYRQHCGFISCLHYPNYGTPDTAIEIPAITKVNSAPYNNDWSVARFEFSPDTENDPLYCDFSKLIRNADAMLPYNTNVTEVYVYVHKIIDFSSPY